MDRPVATLQTPPGTGGIAVIRLVGPGVQAVARALFSAPLPAPGRLALGELRQDGQRIDEALLAGVNAPAGGAVEINVHGGPRVVQRVLAALAQAGAAVADTPAAEPDAWLLAAEGLDNPAIGQEMLAALPAARTDRALAALTAQWSAGLSRLARETLLHIDHLPIASAGPKAPPAQAHGRQSVGIGAGRPRRGPVHPHVRRANGLAPGMPGVSGGRLRRAAEALPQMQRLLNPPEIVLAGPPNAGKSSLANALLGRPACLVSDQPGTTRDWVRELADLAGLAAWLTDTAGLWQAPDALDHQAVARAWARIDEADLVLAVCDASRPPPADDAWARLLGQPHVLRLANKADLAGPPAGFLPVSAATGDGLAALRRSIADAMGLADLDPTAAMAFTTRQANLLHTAANALDAADPASAAHALHDLLGRA